jgi:hypothetical protein
MATIIELPPGFSALGTGQLGFALTEVTGIILEEILPVFLITLPIALLLFCFVTRILPGALGIPLPKLLLTGATSETRCQYGN